MVYDLHHVDIVKFIVLIRCVVHYSVDFGKIGHTIKFPKNALR